MKILLVFTTIRTPSGAFRHALKFIGRKASFPPRGLLTVTAMFHDE